MSSVPASAEDRRCRGISKKGNDCRNFAPDGVWCGTCTGHRPIIEEDIKRSIGGVFETETLDKAWQHPDEQVKAVCVLRSPTVWLTAAKRHECLQSHTLLSALGSRQDLTVHDIAMLLRSDAQLAATPRLIKAAADPWLARMAALHWLKAEQLTQQGTFDWHATCPHTPPCALTADCLQAALATPDHTRLECLLTRMAEDTQDPDWLDAMTAVLSEARRLARVNQGTTPQQMGAVYGLHRLTIHTTMRLPRTHGTPTRQQPDCAHTEHAASECLKLCLELADSAAFVGADTGMSRQTVRTHISQQVKQATLLLEYPGLDEAAAEAGWELLYRAANTEQRNLGAGQRRDAIPDFCLRALADVPSSDDSRIARLTATAATSPKPSTRQLMPSTALRTLLMLPQAGPVTAAALLSLPRRQAGAHRLAETDLERQRKKLPYLLDDDTVVRLAKQTSGPHGHLSERVTLPPAAAEALAKSTSIVARHKITSHPDTPAATVTMLAFDPVPAVADSAASRLSELRRRQSTGT